MSIGFRAPLRQEIDSFHDLWKQYKLGRDLNASVGFAIEETNGRLKIAIAPSQEESLRALESLPQRVRLLIASERASLQQWKGAIKLVHIAQKQLKEATLQASHQGPHEPRTVLLDELASLQIALFQKVIGHDPLPEEELKLASKMGFASFLLDQVRENPSRLLQVEETVRGVIMNYLFVQRELPVIKQLFLQEALLPSLSETLSHEAAPVVQEIVSFLLETGGREEAKRGIVVKALAHLLEKLPAESALSVGDALRAWSVHLDPETKIASGKTLSELFCSCRYPPQANEGVLNRFLQREPNEASSETLCRQFLALPAIRSLAPSLKPEYFPRSFNVVEAAIWFRVRPRTLASLMSLSLLENELSKIRPCLSQEVYERFLFSCWEVDPAHYQEKCYESPTSLPPRMTANDLLSLYDSLSPTPVEEMRVPRADERGRIVECVITRTALQEFVRKVLNRIVFIGTPSAGSPQLEEFYRTIEIHLCHSVKVLGEKKALTRTPEEAREAKEKILSFLYEIADAAPYCGGRYFGTALKEYFKASGQGDTPRKKTLQSLADLRQTIFEQAALRRYDSHNVNGLNAALREHGARWGIPGSDTAASFRDPFGRSIAREDIESAFRASYTAKEIVHWLCPCPQSQEARTLLVDYFKMRPPLGWKESYYQDLEKKAEAIHSSVQLSKEEKERDIRALLSEANIERESGQTPQQAIREAQRTNFMEEYVQDPSYAIRPTAVLQLLEDIGAVRCMFSQDHPLLQRRSKQVNIGNLLGYAWKSLSTCMSETVQGIVGRC